MTRSLLAALALVSFSATGCATISSSAAPAASSGAFQTMNSPPPEAKHEDVPKMSANEVWVPGYYQPVASTWVWHQGEIRETKPGYMLIAASVRENAGKYTFQPPRWRRADLAMHSKATASADTASAK